MTSRQVNKAIKEAAKEGKSTYVQITYNGRIDTDARLSCPDVCKVTRVRTRKGTTQVFSHGRYISCENRFINHGWIDCTFSALYSH